MRKIFLLFLGLAIASCTSETEKIEASENPISQHLDAYFTALTDLKEFNGVILAFKNDSLILDKAYNLFPNPNSSTYVSTESQFDIHSVAKLMTHYLIVKLEEEGRLSEEDPINRFFPDFPKGDQITVKMLLDHSSGLPRELLDLEGNEFDLEPSEIVALAKKQPLLFEPGEDAQYSNVGYELLYEVISQIYGKPFSQCVVDEIFVPLKMDHSGAHFYTNNKRLENPAKNHVLQDTSLVQVPNILEDEFKTARFYSTAADLDRFLKALEKEPYASVLKNEAGVIAKDGGSKGIRAQVYTDLEKDFRFVLLANYDEMPFFKTIEDVSKILDSELVEIPKELNRVAIEVEPDILEQYVGSYSFADFDGLILRVEMEENGIAVFQDNEKIGFLMAESPTVFFENPKEPESFEFIPNEEGSYDVMMGWKGISVKGKRL
ncbi:class A beta-lactamase-related serine hydrolase [Algoriphagus kandeliae]|uniref:Class A beta-lactamase-related serine hydrolase n=1 Tax=Algoriphagus kandeliae TaxID=2562278 RepID=A0A4Y9QT36_9BACT|nr:serine hydrolase domain-containing protein [Algoriphagus kandeliae]TFV95684.1 class A beta-lactamase-related serine hydrolase [Algoriphagus kandeliae]